MGSKLFSVIALFSVLLISVSCKDVDTKALCEVREYHEEMLIGDFEGVWSGTSTGLTNMGIFIEYSDISQPWLINNFVKIRDPYWIMFEGKVDDIKKTSERTTFLSVLANDLETYVFDGRAYFDGRFKKILINKKCPIYIGTRNGSFSLATVRAPFGSKGYQDKFECNALATLTFFGIREDHLPKFEEFITSKKYRSQISYNFEKIRQYLNENSDCKVRGDLNVE